MHKIGRVKAYLILLLAFFIQVTLLNRFMIWGFSPDLLLVCVTFFGLFFGREAGVETGLVAGALMDLFVLDYFGINMFIYGVIGFVVGSLNTSFVKESKRIQALIVFSCAALSMLLHFALASAFAHGIPISLFEYIFCCVLPASAYTTIVSIPVYLKFMDVCGLRRRGEFY